MIKRFFFFISALVFLCGSTSVVLASNGLTTHTQHTPIELKPISFLELDKVYKVASVCFLGSDSCGEASFTTSDEDFTTDTERCIKAGYTTIAEDCEIPYYPRLQCRYNPIYYKLCSIDASRACEELGYVTECSGAEVPDTNNVCEYNSKYFGCTCAPCDGYTFSYSEATATGYEPDGMCQRCDMKRYKRKAKSCAGFLTCECGGEIGTETCKSGTVTKYKTCKECCANECTETTEPPTGTNYRYEACSKKYCITGCATDFTEWCTTPVTDCGTLGYTKTISQCPDGYLKCPYGDTVFCEDN